MYILFLLLLLSSSSSSEEEEGGMTGRCREVERGVEVGALCLFLWWFEGRGEKEAEASVEGDEEGVSES